MRYDYVCVLLGRALTFAILHRNSRPQVKALKSSAAFVDIQNTALVKKPAVLEKTCAVQLAAAKPPPTLLDEKKIAAFIEKNQVRRFHLLLRCAIEFRAESALQPSCPQVGRIDVPRLRLL